jgi:hypothetical protein
MSTPLHLSNVVAGVYAERGAISPYSVAQIHCASLFIPCIGMALDAAPQSDACGAIVRAVLAVWSGLTCAGVPEGEALAVADLLCETFDVPALDALA